jgi:hypothetical protein
MSKKTFRYLFVIAASIVAAIALGSSFRSENTDETRRKPLNLNKTLTNEMSDTSDLAGLDKSITRFMQEWNLQGVSLSIMRNDSLLYAKGYGWADEEKGVRMSPGPTRSDRQKRIPQPARSCSPPETEPWLFQHDPFVYPLFLCARSNNAEGSDPITELLNQEMNM